MTESKHITVVPCLLCGKDASDSDITIFQDDPEFPYAPEERKRLGRVCESCGEHLKAVSEGIREAMEEKDGARG